MTCTIMFIEQTEEVYNPVRSSIMKICNECNTEKSTGYSTNIKKSYLGTTALV